MKVSLVLDVKSAYNRHQAQTRNDHTLGPGANEPISRLAKCKWYPSVASISLAEAEALVKALISLPMRAICDILWSHGSRLHKFNMCIHITGTHMWARPAGTNPMQKEIYHVTMAGSMERGEAVHIRRHLMYK